MARTGSKARSIRVPLVDWLHRLPGGHRRHPEVGAKQELRPVLEPTTPAAAASPRPVVLVTVFGLAGGALEEVLELVARETQSASVTPVFITESLDFDPFRRRRLRFEYLPDRGTRHRLAPEVDWDLYERRRYVLLRDKWQTRSLISFGRAPPPACVAAIRPSEPPEPLAEQASG